MNEATNEGANINVTGNINLNKWYLRETFQPNTCDRLFLCSDGYMSREDNDGREIYSFFFSHFVINSKKGHSGQIDWHEIVIFGKLAFSSCRFIRFELCGILIRYHIIFGTENIWGRTSRAINVDFVRIF